MKTKRFLAFTLSLVMIFSVMTIGAGVASADYVNPYPSDWGGYMAFGDSFTRGMGCSDTWEEETGIAYEYGDNQSRCITGAYPYLVAKALGCKFSEVNYLEEPDSTFWPMTHNGITLAAVNDLLGVEDNYYDSLFYHSNWTTHYYRYEKFVEYFGNLLSYANDYDGHWNIQGSVYDIRSMVENMDVISLQLGQGDVLNRPIFQALHEYTGGDFNFSGMSTEEIAAFVARVIELAYEAYDYFTVGYPLLLEYLTTANPDADIVVISTANPAFGVDLSDDIKIPIGTAFSALTIAMNAKLKQWSEEYGCIYCDISNVDTSAVVCDWDLVGDLFADNNYEVGTHPSPEGHEQIARLIVSALENKNKPASTDITVDLGRFDKADLVMVDSKITTDYTVNNHVLTISNKSKTASVLAVGVVNGKTAAVTVYQLKYDNDNGYSVYRLYTSNDVVSLAKYGLSVARGAVKSIGSLFSK